MSIRSRVLNRLFGLLYGPLELLHEPAGKLLFGPSWTGRRDTVRQLLPCEGLALDVGCGSGKLLSRMQDRRGVTLGIDPSLAMLQRARRAGCGVVLSHAQNIPLVDASAGVVVCSYPGAWILDPSVWAEIARITSVDAPVVVLLGGTVTNGRFASVRSVVVRLIYGSNPEIAMSALLGLGHALIPGSLQNVNDAWGEAVIWNGVRIANI